MCKSVASLCHMEFFFLSLSVLISERESAPADTPAPKSCKCKGEPLASLSITAVSFGWVLRRTWSCTRQQDGPGFCHSARLHSIRKPTSTHPFHPQAVMEPLTTQTGALAQSPQEVEHRRGNRAKHKILVGFLDVS